MSESSAAASAPANVQIGLGAQYIKDFSFENPNAPQIFAELQTAPQVAIDVNVTTRGGQENSYEAALRLRVTAKIGDKTGFMAELTYAGIFVLPPQLSQEQIKLFLLVEAPRLLFPFARAIIGNAVRDSGFPNIILQPIDFMALYQAQRDSVGTMVTAGAA